MHQALWALAVAITEAGREKNGECSLSAKLIPISNRVALRIAPRDYAQPSEVFLSPVSWAHICHPRKYYNRLKRAYIREYDPEGKSGIPYPVKVEVTVGSWSQLREIMINGRKRYAMTLFAATADNISYNLPIHKGCINCGKKLTNIERRHIQLAVIARRAQ
jgi:hypothetical protein